MDSFQRKQFTWPSFAQWRQLHRVLNPKEKIALPMLAVIFIFSFVSFVQGVYFYNAASTPTQGGSITEGMVGSPRFLNPIYADTNDADRDVLQLVYSGILGYNSQGELTEDLALEMPQITEGGKVITVSLKENVVWHDGAPFSADDIVFTIHAIKDPAAKSPIRANWIGVDVEKVSDYKVRFHLLEPYAPFLERLTLKILPWHIWKEVSPENFPLTPLNLQPIGTGPYAIDGIKQNKTGFVDELRLKAYDNYYNDAPFIETLTFRFFKNEEDLLSEANRGTIQSFSLHTIENIQNMNNPAFNTYAFPIPRYFALFFNVDAPSDQKELKSRTVRQALQLALNKKALLETVFGDKATGIDSPFLPATFGFAQPAITETPNQEKARTLLEQEGYTKDQGTYGKAQLSDGALNHDLSKGDEGEDVKKLQQCLAQDSEVYPDGIVNGSFGALTFKAVVTFQEKYADETLIPLGLSKGTGKAGEMTRTKLNALCFLNAQQTTPLSITITTVDQSPLKQLAEEVAKQWEEFGIAVSVQAFPANQLEREIIKPRAYQMLLFGEVLGKIPDPFPFWHSSQIQTPGLNLSVYENKKIDSLLESARKEFETAQRIALFEEMQELLLEDIPAIFLYDIDHYYFVSKQVQGIQTPVLADPSQRFSAITDWFIKTKKERK